MERIGLPVRRSAPLSAGIPQFNAPILQPPTSINANFCTISNNRCLNRAGNAYYCSVNVDNLFDCLATNTKDCNTNIVYLHCTIERIIKTTYHGNC